jgi:hypothetical protein
MRHMPVSTIPPLIPIAPARTFSRTGSRVFPCTIQRGASQVSGPNWAKILCGELADQPDLRRQHAVTNSVIDVHGDVAEGVSDLSMYDRVGDGPVTIRRHARLRIGWW